jgi:tetratricopeptide (TPR) repeat protein
MPAGGNLKTFPRVFISLGICISLVLVAVFLGTCSKPPPTYRISAGKEGYTHKIAEGETLEEIAGRYYDDTHLGKALGEYNGLDPTEPLNPGNTLLVPFDRSELEGLRTAHQAHELYNKGTMYARTGQYEDAIYYLESAVAASPAHVDAWYNLALVYQKTERYEDAGGILERLVDSFPSEKTYRYSLGANFRAQEHRKKALDQFKKALKIDPEYNQAQYALALTYQDLGKQKKAVRAWERYLELDQESIWSEEARLHLENLQRR